MKDPKGSTPEILTVLRYGYLGLRDKKGSDTVYKRLCSVQLLQDNLKVRK